MKYSCKVNPKGQITIPSQIRKMLEIKEEDILLAKTTEEGSIVLEGGCIKIIDKDREMLLRVLEETFGTLKKREEDESEV